MIKNIIFCIGEIKSMTYPTVIVGFFHITLYCLCWGISANSYVVIILFADGGSRFLKKVAV